MRPGARKTKGRRLPVRERRMQSRAERRLEAARAISVPEMAAPARRQLATLTSEHQAQGILVDLLHHERCSALVIPRFHVSAVVEQQPKHLISSSDRCSQDQQRVFFRIERIHRVSMLDQRLDDVVVSFFDRGFHHADTLARPDHVCERLAADIPDLVELQPQALQRGVVTVVSSATPESPRPLSVSESVSSTVPSAFSRSEIPRHGGP
eukprot:3454145-Rhodomonas_salina.6